MLIFTMAWRNIFRQRRRTLLTGAAMVAGFGFQALAEGKVSDFSLNAEARVPMFKRTYP